MGTAANPIFPQCQQRRNSDMKQLLDAETRAAMIDYRMERAYSTLGEADLLYEGGYFNAAINRLYYACYYATIALLLKYGIETSTHNGVKTQLSMHFVRTGRLSLEHSTTFGLLFDKRHSSDYADFAYCDASLIEMLRPRAEAFINAIKTLIKESTQQE